MAKMKLLSNSNPFYLDRHEFYAALHYAYQYPTWIEQLSAIESGIDPISYSGMPGAHNVSNPTQVKAFKADALRFKISSVRDAVTSTDEDLAPWLLPAVTREGVTYARLSAAKDPIPCSQSTFCRRRREIYYKIWKALESRLDGDNSEEVAS